MPKPVDAELVEMVWKRLIETDFERGPYVTEGLLQVGFPDVKWSRLEPVLTEFVHQGRLDYRFDREWGRVYFPANPLVHRLCAQQAEGGRMDWRKLVDRHELSPTERRRLPLLGDLWPHMTREAKIAVLVVTGLPKKGKTRD